MDQYCGYIALLGRPNAGKSTLLNACLGQKIAGVSQKPQTTRNRIVGIDTIDDRQMIFLDTPGLHRSAGKPRINHMMNKEAWSVVGDADLICYLVDLKAGWHPEDRQYLGSIVSQAKAPVLILGTKADSLKKFLITDVSETIQTEVKNLLFEASKDESILAGTALPWIISAKRPEDIAEFRSFAANRMPAGPFLYDPEDLTDRPQSFVAAEMIREQVFRRLGDELPYGTSVVVERVTHEGTLAKIGATIIVSRPSHKPMVIGKAGQSIKAIGVAARESLERHFGCKVFLELFVRVQPDWVDNAALVSEFQGLDA